MMQTAINLAPEKLSTPTVFCHHRQIDERFVRRIGEYRDVCRPFGSLAKLQNLNEQELQQAAKLLIYTCSKGHAGLLADEHVQIASLL